MNQSSLAESINQFLNQYFNTQIPTETIPYLLAGFALIVLLGIFLLIYFYRIKSSPKIGKRKLSEKATEKKLAQFEKIQLKQQKVAEEKREQIEKQKHEKKLSRIQEKTQDIQEELERKEKEQLHSQILQKELPSPPQETIIPEADTFLERLRKGMEKTRNNFMQGLGNVALGKKEIDGELLEEFEELLIVADIGPETTYRILNAITEKLEREQLKDPQFLREMLQSEIVSIMEKKYEAASTEDKKPLVLLFVGVNGVGKTTTIGKVAAQYQNEGKKVLMGAGDTFRAAAIEQLTEWSERAGCDVVAKAAQSDPASVMYETLQKALDDQYDVVICDTAGRLHTKKNLMEELKKMVRVMQKLIPDAPHEIFLVLDATTGQNAIFQVREFSEIATLTGLVITKLDGTAKGGVVIGIVNEFDIPVRFIGVGEGINDLRPFNAADFTQSLFA